MADVLSLVRVAKFYGHRPVLRDITQTFAAGSLAMLVGSNGSGKSTLMRIMAGLARPSAGQVRLADGVSVGHVAHATFIYPGLTALENLTFWGRACGLRSTRNDVMAALEHVGLASHAHERAGIFSRGMAQKLNLARVLLQAPDVLLLDEPGTGLDQSALALLRQEMLAAKARGACVVLISHDLQGDMPLADVVCRLEGGRLTLAAPQESGEVAACGA